MFQYDAIMLLDAAVKEAGPEDPDKFRAALKKADFKSLRGNFKFNNNNFPIQDIILQRVEKTADGKFDVKFLEVIKKDVAGSSSRLLPAERLIASADRTAAAAMSIAFLAEQSFNALQLGLMLFLMAVGVTLAFGTMRLINLAHGSFFMLAAYFYALDHRRRPIAGSLAWIGALRGPCCPRYRHRAHRHPAALSARPSRTGARHLRADPDLQRCGDDDLGARSALHAAARISCPGMSCWARSPIRPIGWSSPRSRS